MKKIQGKNQDFQYSHNKGVYCQVSQSKHIPLLLEKSGNSIERVDARQANNLIVQSSISMSNLSLSFPGIALFDHTNTSA